MLSGLGVPLFDGLSQPSHVIRVEPYEDDGICPGVKGQTFCGTRLAIADRLVHFRESPDVTLME
jgi:hypothetical protein